MDLSAAPACKKQKKPNNFTTKSSISRLFLPLPQHRSPMKELFQALPFAGGRVPHPWQSTSSKMTGTLGRNVQGRTHRRSFYISRLGKSCEASLAAGVKVFQDEMGRAVCTLGLLQLTTALLTHTSGHTCFLVHRESIWLCQYDVQACTTPSLKPLVPEVHRGTIQKTENCMFVPLCVGQNHYKTRLWLALICWIYLGAYVRWQWSFWPSGKLVRDIGLHLWWM